MTSSPDVLVIGGGIVGAATAYQLARRGASVVLLEAERLAFGATGRNLGYIWLHTRRRGPELDLVMPTRDTLESLPEELGADFGLRTNGGLIYFTTEDQAVVMREFVERRTADGVPMRLLDGDEAREIAPILPDSVIGATFCPLDAQIDSTRYVGAFGGRRATGRRPDPGGNRRPDDRDRRAARHARPDRHRSHLGRPRRARCRSLEPVPRRPARRRGPDRRRCASRSSRPSRWRRGSTSCCTDRRR